MIEPDGNIMMILPGTRSWGVFAPQSDTVDTSLLGRLVAKFLSDQVSLTLFATMLSARDRQMLQIFKEGRA
jgi:hypothetical protein